MDRELDKMEQDLEDLVNLTRGAQDKVVYLKDSETQAQKQAPGSAIYHYLWIEKFFNAKCVQRLQWSWMISYIFYFLNCLKNNFKGYLFVLHISNY